MTKKKVLVAEDEKPIARALELKLNGSGFEAKAVHDGEEALAELASNKYDLLLLDLQKFYTKSNFRLDQIIGDLEKALLEGEN